MKGLYVIYDKAAEKTGPVFEAENDAIAVRAASISLLEAHDARDFDLVKIGTIDGFQVESQKFTVVPFYEFYDKYLEKHLARLQITSIKGGKS